MRISFEMSNAQKVSDGQEASPVISIDAERHLSGENEEIKLLNDAAQSLPADAVKDLLSNEVRVN